VLTIDAEPKVVSDPLSADDDSDVDFSRTVKATGRTLVKTPSSSRPQHTYKSTADHQIPGPTLPTTSSASRRPQPARKAKDARPVSPLPVALDELDHRVAEDDNDAYLSGDEDSFNVDVDDFDDDGFDEASDDQGLFDLERELRESDPQYIGEEEFEDDEPEEEDDNRQSSTDDIRRHGRSSWSCG